MAAFRDLRRELGLSQQEFARRLGISDESCRAWDSGRRTVPTTTLHAARQLVVNHLADHAWLRLSELAEEFHLNIHTLRAAVRRGQLEARFEARSVFGRPTRRSTRAACRAYLGTSFGRRLKRSVAVAPLVEVPRDYDACLKRLRGRLRLTQSELASRIGAAGKAVVYQWESRKRAPSPVFWREIEALASRRPAAQESSESSAIPCARSSEHSPSTAH